MGCTGLGANDFYVVRAQVVYAGSNSSSTENQRIFCNGQPLTSLLAAPNKRRCDLETGCLYVVVRSCLWGVGARGQVGSRAAGCGLAARPLPAHHRRTRRKYVPVGSYAASMPRKVPRRWTGKDPSRESVCTFASKSMRCAVWITLGPTGFSPPSRCKRDSRQASTRDRPTSLLPRLSNKLSGKQPTNCLVRCPRRLRDRVAAWMPPPSLHGRIHGVSRKR
ncbi:hypothetical protein GGR69_001272 [Xanthomonas arboricola]|nr:hypothetical protein [Xanthomonas arboricola]